MTSCGSYLNNTNILIFGETGLFGRKSVHTISTEYNSRKVIKTNMLGASDIVDAAIECSHLMKSGGIFVPNIPGMHIVGLLEALSSDCDSETIGFRPGEELHEVLITEEEKVNH